MNTVSEDMEDSDVVKVVNEQNETNGTDIATSFLFSLKNRVGGLARALKVFQVKIFKNKHKELITCFTN